MVSNVVFQNEDIKFVKHELSRTLEGQLRREIGRYWVTEDVSFDFGIGVM